MQDHNTMKNALAFVALALAGYCQAQCPFKVILNNTGLCAGRDTLVLTGTSLANLSKITWYNGALADTTVTAVTTAINNQIGVTVAGGNGRGAAANQFNLPNAVFMDGTGNLYVSDITNYRIQKFPPGSTQATYGQTAAGSNGVGPAGNQFQPNAVCIDAIGYMYVADNANARILRFPQGSTDTTDGTVVAGGNGQGNGANQFINAVSVYVDANGYIYVIDAANYRLQRFPPGSNGSTNATTVAGAHGYGPDADQFNGAAGVHVDSAGNIYVADAANNRIQKFLPSATNAITVAGGNGFGAGLNQLSTPSSVWVDGAGNIYVADVNNERIQKFPPGSTSATYGKTVAGGNGPGNGPTQFSGPNSVCVDKDGYIYVSDAGNNRIQRFSQNNDSISVIDSIFVPQIPGTYSAVVTDSKGCRDTTNAINISPSVKPLINITATQNTPAICTKQILDTLNFTANASNTGDSPKYQWQVNGVNKGANSIYFTAALAQNDKVTCTLNSTAICAIPPTVTSVSYTVPVFKPISVNLTSNGQLCAGTDTLVVTCNSSIAAIEWYLGATMDYTMTAPADFSTNATSVAYVPIKPGAYKAVVTDAAGCKDSTASLIISSYQLPAVSISPNPSSVCEGDSITFNINASNAGSAPIYQWLLNGLVVGVNSPSYTTGSLGNGDVIACAVTGRPGCYATDTSNNIIASVWPRPVVGSISNVSILPGQTITLSLPVTGQVASYIWQPPAGLSNTTAVSPVASPEKTTAYTLTVVSPNGCKANGSVTVEVSYPIYIPGVFTPNGDGRNDIFYIGGGHAGDKIKNFAVYGRWGQKMFEAENILPGDPTVGWNGNYNGKSQAPGAYVYLIVITSADGIETVYKGTVVLVR